jgi:excisionase family DNA binding protein
MAFHVLTITHKNGKVKVFFEYYGKGATMEEMKQGGEKELYSIRELCQKTGKCYRTIHRAIKDGKIKDIRLGGSVMIPRREVERILVKGF